MILIVLVAGIVAFGTLAMRRAPLWQWAVAALVLGLLSRISIDGGLWLLVDVSGWVFALLPAVVLGSCRCR